MTLLSTLVATSQAVAGSSSRLAKIRALASCLRELQPAEVETAVLYLSGDTPQGRFGIGFAALRSASTGPPATVPTLSIADTDAQLAAVAALRGPGAAARRIAALRTLFNAASASEREFLIRLLLGELRQGALAGLMLEAIAVASEIPLAQVRRAAMYAPQLGAVAAVAMTKGVTGLRRFTLEVLSPIAPMLAQTAGDVGEALRTLAGDVAFEWKMDGARIQVHRAGSEVRVYSRSSNDVTAALPEVVEVARALPSPDLVLDGEAIAYTEAGRPHPFQVTMRRFGRKLDVESARASLSLRAYFFDCLRRDGVSLADRPARERFTALDELLPEPLRMPRLITADEAEAQRFLDAALAAGHEGVMAKALDSVYEAGNRGASWLKIKRAHTLDLVVLAAEWGHGRRTGKLSNLHLGAMDVATGDYVMLGKTFKGLTDAMLAWQTEQLLAREERRDDWTVYVRPELVVEVAFSDLQSSPRYPGGLALRLARVKRYRDDKRAEEADTMDTVRRIYASQTGVQ